MKEADITDVVDAAARSAAMEIVGQTVGGTALLAAPKPPQAAIQPPATTEAMPAITSPNDLPTTPETVGVSRSRTSRNGRRPNEEQPTDPNA